MRYLIIWDRSLLQTGHGIVVTWCDLSTKDVGNETSFYNVEIKAKENLWISEKIIFVSSTTIWIFLFYSTKQNNARGKCYTMNKSKLYTALMKSWPWYKPLSRFRWVWILMNLTRCSALLFNQIGRFGCIWSRDFVPAYFCKCSYLHFTQKCSSSHCSTNIYTSRINSKKGIILSSILTIVPHFWWGCTFPQNSQSGISYHFPIFNYSAVVAVAPTLTKT